MALHLSATFVIADPLDAAFAPLLRQPDLTPLLSPSEVALEFTPWVNWLEQERKGKSVELATAIEGARAELGQKLNAVNSITFYSLVPAPEDYIEYYYPKRVAEIKKLPRFHEFRILGLLATSAKGEAARWADFLRNQIIPNPVGLSLCEFRPRLGLRFNTDKGDVDMLMCFECGHLGMPGVKPGDWKFSPVFSSAVQTQLDQLFDKNKD